MGGGGARSIGSAFRGGEGGTAGAGGQRGGGVQAAAKRVAIAGSRPPEGPEPRDDAAAGGPPGRA
ncbi:MAG: hypothetical protein OXC68_09540 [Aestuariivita sp.]|nr:hypothetical protein [Aestuariivita sp.]